MPRGKSKKYLTACYLFPAAAVSAAKVYNVYYCGFVHMVPSKNIEIYFEKVPYAQTNKLKHGNFCIGNVEFFYVSNLLRNKFIHARACD